MNILLIVDDDHPPYMMEPLPFTRKYIRDLGVNFSEAHADIPLCGPARVAMLTGMSVNTTGVNVNNTWKRFRDSPLSLQEKIIPRFLKEAGYVTGHFGKYVNGHSQTTMVPAYWDKWVETVGDGKDEPWINIDGTIEATEKNVSVLAAEACGEFIRALAGENWFAHFCPTAPHRPYTPGAPYSEMYDGDERDVPSVDEDNADGKPYWMRGLPVSGAEAQHEFEGRKEELRELDQQAIKPLIQTLEETGEIDNTLILFTSDNGYHHGEHRLMRKDRPYWESAQVPFCVRAPGATAGLTSTALVSHLDLLPTALDAAGVPIPDHADGRSVLPLLETGSTGGWRKRILVTGSAASGPEDNPGGAKEPSGHWWMLRDVYRQLILRQAGSKTTNAGEVKEKGHRELYWINSDPYQMHSKADSADPKVVESMVDYALAIKDAQTDERRELEQQ